MSANTDSRNDKEERIEILLIGGSPDLSQWVQLGLEGFPYREIRRPQLGTEDQSGPERFSPHLALVDEDLEPGFPERLAGFKARHPRCQILLVGREDSHLNPRQLGSNTVRHWFFRPVETDAVVGTLQAAGRSLSREWRQRQRHSRSLTGFETFLGAHPRLMETLDLARRVAQSPTTGVLVLGETGTGKGMLAKAIHGESPRRDGPFVDINCAAIPPELLESELFGHVSGAFTSAHRDKPGLLELADGGTAFLDEIGELDTHLQAKILKFLDDGVIRRVQGTETLKVDVRMIAATNRDLQREAESGRFRSDLYHRLGVVVLLLPALRERPDDIPLLARHFLGHFSRRMHRGSLDWSHDALRSLAGYSWPGNVRELINLCERLALLSEGGRTLEINDLPSGIVPAAPVYQLPSRAEHPVVNLPDGGLAYEDVERSVMEEALRRNDGNVTRAAAFLRMGRGSFRYRLERLGLQEKASNRRGRPMGRRRRAA